MDVILLFIFINYLLNSNSQKNVKNSIFREIKTFLRLSNIPTMDRSARGRGEEEGELECELETIKYHFIYLNVIFSNLNY